MSTSSGEKTKKPYDSNFKQQTLPAWQPIATAGTVLPAFFVVGIALIPIGVALLLSSDNVKEFSYDYTYCQATNKNMSCADMLENTTTTPPVVCKCEVSFKLDEDYPGQVYMYYGLSNFYQNHRRYVKSRDDFQLLGAVTEVNSECEPFRYVALDPNNPNDKRPVVPCGAIANSLFNDTLKFTYNPLNSKAVDVPLNRTGIAWPTDKEKKFRNPEGILAEVYKNFSKPISWSKSIWELDLEDPSNNGLQNEDLIVWMRTAALPQFRKLYRIIRHEEATPFAKGLPAGNYTLKVDYAYPVKPFDGTKRFILSTTSAIGGKNSFLGIAYIVVGSICLVLGVALLVVHIKYGKNVNEIINVTPRSPYQ